MVAMVFNRHRQSVPAPMAPRPRNPMEAFEQTKLAEWLDGRGLHWEHIPNEGERTAQQGAALRRQGLKKGVPDVYVHTPPPRHPLVRGVAVELKRRDGSESDVKAEQRYRMKRLRECGWLTHVAYGARDAIEYLKTLGF